ncbi:hypothetical protein KY312_02450 [Candidatus Woesearchaeota archaeon]|nr:hypothetical protein [Candidatus Woesearchaeota archaeon]
MENYQNRDEFADMVQYLRNEGIKKRGLTKRFESEPAYASKPNLGYLARILADAVAAD